MRYGLRIEHGASATGHVTTRQFKAWDDSVRMATCMDPICKHCVDSKNGMLMWMANFGDHRPDVGRKVSKRIM